MIKNISFHEASRDDLPKIVALFFDDTLGKTREDPNDLSLYEYAMNAILKDPNNTIWIADIAGELAGTLQLTFIPNLTFKGRLRAQIEGVRTKNSLRGQGIGAALIEHAIQQAKKCGCCMVQLTSNSARSDAIKFYKNHGFEATHVGLKLYLE